VLAGGAAWLYLSGPLPHGDPTRGDPSAPAVTAAEGPETPEAGAEAEDATVPPPPSARTETAANGDGAPPDLPPAGDPARADRDAGRDAEQAAELGVAPTPAPGPALPADPPPPPMVDRAWLASTQTPLPAVPDPDLLEDSLDGPLPRPGSDGQTPWQAYARPFQADGSQPRIAIVFGSLGLASPPTVRAIADLPGQVTLSLSPFASNLEDWVEQARSKGHEVLLTLPVQPPGYPVNDPGPHALLGELSATENAARLRWTLSRAAGYVGVATEGPSPIVGNADLATPLMAALAGHGLLFLEGTPGGSNVAAEAARAGGTPYARVDLHLDAIPTPAAVDAALAELERLARENGQAIGFARPLPLSIDRIAAWAQALEEKGFAFAPLSGIIAAAESG